ncbi:aspartyl/asparaginyl beta-hydroxylase domain-containing protein [Rhizobium straminoryzae]|uniref:Aspartyl/asparaginyl beta-hydroxylase domain-containing protein n=2 Tax=Rhizobium TaxID=379 RepID=A0A549T227_9HYPH|nr:aspartyl/asparaginyl beta-hydroxylase domain-containing protein [Rhizobium straminoryzae]
MWPPVEPSTVSASPNEQTFGTQGIAPMDRPSRITRFFMAIVAWAEGLNLKYAKLGNPPVYDNATFPWAAEVEKAYPAIRAELDQILKRKDELPSFQDISTDVKTISTDNNWKTFFLLGFGVKSEQNIKACPETWKAMQKIPGLTTVMFSIFEPGKHLPAHRGPYNGVLRLHLGMIVPPQRDKIAIRVKDQICHWDEGKVLIFDDAYEHEAWNHSDQTRVVLFVDFVKPLKFPARLVNWCLMNLAIFTPFIREGLDNHNEWEKKFYAEAEKLRNRPH